MSWIYISNTETQLVFISDMITPNSSAKLKAPVELLKHENLDILALVWHSGSGKKSVCILQAEIHGWKER